MTITKENLFDWIKTNPMELTKYFYAVTYYEGSVRLQGNLLEQTKFDMKIKEKLHYDPENGYLEGSITPEPDADGKQEGLTIHITLTE